MSEEACPFCGDSLDASFRSAPAPVPPSRRLSRSALFAYGTGALVLAPTAFVMIACDMTQIEYGTPPLFDAGEQDSALTEPDVYVVLGDSAYGGPPVDSSNVNVHVESADAGDSSVEDANAGDASVADADSDTGADAGDAD